MRLISIFLMTLIGFVAFSQKKVNELDLSFDYGSVPLNFYEIIKVYKNDTLISKYEIPPARNTIGVPNLVNTSYKIQLHTHFKDSVIKHVDLRHSNQTLNFENIYEVVGSDEIKTLINQSKRLFIYLLEYGEQPGINYTHTTADIRLDYKFGSIEIDKTDIHGPELSYKFMTYKINESIQTNIDKLISTVCTTDKKKRKKKHQRYPTIVIASKGKILVMEYCIERKTIFQEITDLMELNKIDVYQR